MNRITTIISRQKILYILVTNNKASNITKLSKISNTTYAHVSKIIKEFVGMKLLTKTQIKRSMILELTTDGLLIANTIKQFYDTVSKIENRHKYKK